jgi:hypothetical protein
MASSVPNTGFDSGPATIGFSLGSLSPKRVPEVFAQLLLQVACQATRLK